MKHSHQVIFGRRVDGCPRCEELKAGAPVRHGYGWQRKQDEARTLAIRRHDFAACAAVNVVCTHFEW